MTIFDTFEGTTWDWRFLCCTLLASKLLIKVLDPAFDAALDTTVLCWTLWGCGESWSFWFDKIWDGFFTGVVGITLGADESWDFKMELNVVFWGGLQETGAEGVVTGKKNF